MNTSRPSRAASINPHSELQERIDAALIGLIQSWERLRQTYQVTVQIHRATLARQAVYEQCTRIRAANDGRAVLEEIG